jgi:hypothetical protein
MGDSLDNLKYPIGKFQRPESFSTQLLNDWMNILEAAPLWLDICIENLDEHQLQVPYRDGGWNIQQVIHHVADSHINAYVRLKLTLTEDNPQIKPYREALWAELPDTELVPINISLTLLHALHRRWTALLRQLQPGQWERTYHHPEQGRDVPLWEMTAMYAWHSRHHMEHIRQLRERMNW